MKSLHYSILRLIHTAVVMGEFGLSSTQLRLRLYPDHDLDPADLYRVLVSMCDPAWHVDGPLLECLGGVYTLSGNPNQPGADDPETGAYRVLAEARRNVALRSNEKQWIDRMRNPITEADSLRCPVAVPTGSSKSGYTGDPEKALGRTESHSRFAQLKRDGARRCPRCSSWKKLSDFSGRDRYCKHCRRTMARRRRRKDQ